MFAHAQRRLLQSHSLLLTMGVVHLFAAALLFHQHLSVVHTVQDTAVPLLAQLPDLKQQSSVLAQQVELMELRSAVAVGSPTERVNSYVLPPELSAERVVASLETVLRTLEDADLASKKTDVHLGETVVHQTYRSTPVTVDVALHEDGLRTLLTFVRHAGTLTVADALTVQQRSLLLKQTEAENPAGIRALEQFLGADLLDYARNPQSYRNSLAKSFSGEQFMPTFDTIVRTSALRSANEVFAGELGDKLHEQRLWPLPLMQLASLTQTPGSVEEWYQVSLTVDAYSQIQ